MARKMEGASHIDAWSYGPEELHRIKKSNIRYGLRKIEKMAAQLAKDGQLQLGIIRFNAQGEPVLIDGHRRLAGVELINLDPSLFGKSGPMSFGVRVKKATDEEAKELALAANLDRDDLSAVDLAFAARSLEDDEWDRKRIADRLGFKSVSRISGLFKLFDLPARVLNLVHNDLLKESHAIQLLGLKPGQIEDFADRIEAGEKSSKLLGEIKAAARDNGKPKPRTLAEIRKALQANGGGLATSLLAYMDGDPTVSTIDKALEG